MSSHRVLVTGGTGFLGQHLVRALRERGYKVRVLVRPRQSSGHDLAIQTLKALGAELAPGDVLELPALQAALSDISHVFHLAGRLYAPSVPTSAYERIHVDGTRNLLTACLTSRSLQAIVHCSTTGVLGPTGPSPASEDAPQHPSNDYERTKGEGEGLALSIAREHGLPLSVARPALVYGPGDLHLLGWFRAINNGYYRVVGSGDNLIHPIYIDDLIDGMLRCAETRIARGRAYNLVGDRPVPMRELAAEIASALGRRLPRRHLPLAFTYGAAALLETLPGVPAVRLPLTRSRVAFMTENRAYCGARARDELGFVPQIDLKTGLQHTVAWYRSNRFL